MSDDRRHGPTPPSGPDHRSAFPGYQGMELPALHRYVTGESEEAERRRVESWAGESAERRQYLDAMRRLYGQAAVGTRREAAAAWRAIMARMEPSMADEVPAYRAPWDAAAVRVDVRRARGARRARVLLGAFRANRTTHWALPFSAAAAIVIAALGVLAAGRAPRRPAAPATTMRTVATTRGQRAEIRLDDGTTVVLGVDSRLQFASNFGSDTRDVYLDGTAYFRVVHDTTKPFTVHTTTAVTRDVGTRFVVRSYPADRSTAVVVTEGSVALQAPGAPPATGAVLTRDQMGVLSAGAEVASVSRVDPSRYTAWMEGELVFHDAALSDVARELRRWYDVDVVLGDSTLRRVPFSASFAVESFREALATVTTVLPLRAVRHGRVVTLYRK